MKTKKFHKKLALNKRTIVHLGNEDLKKIGGGDWPCATGEIPSCITFNGYTCRTCAGYSNCKTCLLTGVPICLACGWPVD